MAGYIMELYNSRIESDSVTQRQAVRVFAHTKDSTDLPTIAGASFYTPRVGEADSGAAGRRAVQIQSNPSSLPGLIETTITYVGFKEYSL